MVLAFLQAESRSPRFSQALSRKGINPKVLFRPNLGDTEENEIRLDLLGAYRGYGKKTFSGHYKGRWLFKNFPADVQWYRETLTTKDLLKCFYLNHYQWKTIAGNSRKVADGVKNFHKTYVCGVTENVYDVMKALSRGEVLPEIILAETKTGKRIILEGHTRATAHAIRGTEVEALIGVSPSMSKWEKQVF